MNKAIAIKIIKHFVIFIIILLCLSAIPATFMAMSPFNDMREYEAWGFCEGYTILDDCEGDLYDRGIIGIVFRYFLIGYAKRWFLPLLCIYLIILCLWNIFVYFIDKQDD